MTYRTVANMVQSQSLSQRLFAAASTEGVQPPQPWVSEHIWQLAASPGWALAWESAVAGGITDPGDNEGVITDGMILSAVQGLIVDPENTLPE